MLGYGLNQRLESCREMYRVGAGIGFDVMKQNKFLRNDDHYISPPRENQAEFLSDCYGR